MDGNMMLWAVAIEGLVGITVLVGFLYHLARKDAQRDASIQTVRDLAEKNAANLKEHDDGCKDEWNKNDRRLAEIERNVAVMATNQSHIKSDMLELKGDTKTLLQNVIAGCQPSQAGRQDQVKSDLSELKDGIKSLLAAEKR